MKPAQAKQLIEVLASGFDPLTGESLPDGSLVNSPPVLRALFLASAGLELLDKQLQRKAAEPVHAGAPWSDDEDQKLGAAFDRGESVPQMARTHQRSPGAITSRLMLIGRLSAKGSSG